MKILLSPAKSMSPNLVVFKSLVSSPQFKIKSLEIVNILKKWSKDDFKINMKLSENLAEKTLEEFQNLDINESSNGTPAINLYSGTAFRSLDIQEMNLEDALFAQDNLFILSGLYGLLKPFDIIQPYRLEMGLRFKISKDIESLYKFWKNELTNFLNESFTNELILNLASNEYFKAIDLKMLNLDVLNFNFLVKKNGKEKIVANYSKMARGLMARFIIKNKIKNKEDLKDFKSEGFSFIQRLSTENIFYYSKKII